MKRERRKEKWEGRDIGVKKSKKKEKRGRKKRKRKGSAYETREIRGEVKGNWERRN